MDLPQSVIAENNKKIVVSSLAEISTRAPNNIKEILKKNHRGGPGSPLVELCCLLENKTASHINNDCVNLSPSKQYL